MYYVSNGKVYIKEGNAYRNVGFTAKDKVITRRELESTSIVMGSVVVDKLDSPIPFSEEEIIAKFNLSEENPITLLEDIPVAETVETEVETAETAEIEVPVKKTGRRRKSAE